MDPVFDHHGWTWCWLHSNLPASRAGTNLYEVKCFPCVQLLQCEETELLPGRPEGGDQPQQGRVPDSVNGHFQDQRFASAGDFAG